MKVVRMVDFLVSVLVPQKMVNVRVFLWLNFCSRDETAYVHSLSAELRISLLNKPKPIAGELLSGWKWLMV